MSSLVIKLGSLVIKTLSKPIANRIKGQAREHERFRNICVQTAQAIHRWDMRFKLGLLQDTAAIERQTAREAAEAQSKKHKHETSGVKDDDAAASKDKSSEKGKETTKVKPKIRPLSEAKAIDAGANFVSETFLLLVGVALIVGEQWRQSRKASSRREDIAERLAELEEYEKSARRGLVELEREVIRLRSQDKKSNGPQPHILPSAVWELEEREEAEEKPKPQSWTDWISSGLGLAAPNESPSSASSQREGEEQGNSVLAKASPENDTNNGTLLGKMLPWPAHQGENSPNDKQVATPLQDSTNDTTPRPKAR